jgi:kynurenine formamidase
LFCCTSEVREFDRIEWSRAEEVVRLKQSHSWERGCAGERVAGPGTQRETLSASSGDREDMRLVDLSRTLENAAPADPPGFGPLIEYSDHKRSLPQMLQMFPGLQSSEVPEGEAWAMERLAVTTHNGTHVDAPWHYASTMNGGERAWTIDEVPLDWFYHPGLKLDFRDSPDGHVVTATELAERVASTGHTLQPFDIVLMNTRAGAAYGNPAYVDSGCGFGREATLWLLERGVRVLGTDGWSWDAPFSFTRRRFEQTHDPSIIWEGHKAGRNVGYCQIEKLANLEQLPAAGFMVSCFPFKIKGGSAGFTRAVAIL